MDFTYYFRDGRLGPLIRTDPIFILLTSIPNTLWQSRMACWKIHPMLVEDFPIQTFPSCHV